MDRFRRRGSSEELGLDTDPLGFNENQQSQAMPQQSYNAAPPEQDNPFGSSMPNNQFSSNNRMNEPRPFSDYESERPMERPIIRKVDEQASQPMTHLEKDVQIVLAKLDAIKSELDSLQQRVQKIERIAEADQLARDRKPPVQW
jgi:hypothetical protein